ncbi:MAG: hypothetical protein KJ593_05565 [Candidatus Omnitrophica bacterium]|nr:hypothetical protein [Candidatus Omnitrophota bacterium]
MVKLFQTIKSIFVDEKGFCVPKDLKKYVCAHDELLKKTGNLNLSGTVIKLRRNGDEKK